MPYIKQDRRETLAEDAINHGYADAKEAGELNYLITDLCLNYFRRKGGRYQQINDVMGALEGAKLEFYRRVAASYEDKKIVENGDVY